MPLTPLREALSVSSEGFNFKLQNLMQTAQSFKQGQLAKQRMAEELQAKKDLIQFRSDVELEQQEELRRQQAPQRALEQYNDSLEQARDATQQYANEAAKKRYSSISEYNLGDYKFGVENIESNGQAVAKPSIYYDAPGQNTQPQEMDYQTFLDDLEQKSSFGDRLNKVETADDKIQSRFVGDTIEVGNDQQGKDYIQRIKQDPEFAREQYNAYLQGRVRIGEEVDPEGLAEKKGSTIRATGREAVGLVQNLRSELGGQTELEFGFQGDFLEDEWYKMGVFGQEENARWKIDFTSSVGDVQQQIVDTIGQTLPEGEKNFAGQFSEAEQTMIATGNTDDEALEQLPEKRAEQVRRLAGYNEETRQNMARLFNIYNTYEGAYGRYINETSQQFTKGEVYLDMWNSPRDLSTTENFKKLFRPITDVQSKAKMTTQGKRYGRDVEATRQLLNQ